MKKNFTKTKEYKELAEINLFFMRLGAAVFEARKNRGMSQSKLAKEAKTTQKIISLIENADDYNMGTELFYRIFKVLNLDLKIDNYSLIFGGTANKLSECSNDDVKPINNSTTSPSSWTWQVDAQKMVDLVNN